MLTIVKKVIGTFSAAIIMVPAIAQKTDKTEKTKKVEVEQIIITNKNADEKMTIVVDGDKVTINGKDAKDVKDGNVIIRRNRGDRLQGATAQGHNLFRVDGQEFKFFNEDENKAMLGVITDKVDEGAKITQVNEETAADKAGLKEGDIIISVGDTKIEDPDALSKAIQAKKPGDKVTVTYLRDKKKQTANVELGKWKGVRMNAFSYSPGMAPDVRIFENINPRVHAMPRIPGVPGGEGFYWNMDRPRLGLSIQDTEDGKGVKVLEADEEGNAGKAGIKEGDIITEIDGKKVNSADEITKIVRENKDNNSMMMKLTRDGKTHNIEVKIPRKLKTAEL